MAYDHTCPFYNARMHTLILRHQVEQEVRLEHTRYHVTITMNIISHLHFQFAQKAEKSLVPPCASVSFQMSHAPMTQCHLVPDLAESARLSRHNSRNRTRELSCHYAL